MSDGNGAPAAPSHAPRAIAPGRPITPINPDQFGKKAELAEKLKSILKDVPVLHDRMKKAVTDFEEVVSRARAIVEEWERVNEASKS
jgi:hypothetical protein